MTSVSRNEAILQRLATGPGEPVVVADFQPFSSAPRISRLLADLAKGRPVFQVEALGSLSGVRRYVPLQQLAAESAGSFLASGPAHRHVSIVGHCSAAALSLHIAMLLANSHEVTVTLLGPSWPDEADVKSQFAEFQSTLGAQQRPCPDLNADPSSSVAAMERILRDQIVAVAARRGLARATESFLDLMVRYRAWLAFLLACRNAPAIVRAKATSIHLVTDADGDATIPGLGPDAYDITRLPGLKRTDSDRPELAMFALTQIEGRSR